MKILEEKNKDLIKKIEKWVNETHPHPKHLIRTGYWIKKLDPNCGDAMYIAAVSHDIERAFKEDRNPPGPEMDGAVWDDPVYNLWHGERSAKFVSEFLENENVNQETISEVYELVKHHEDGGFDKADILKDADSISFLEINSSRFISLIPEVLSEYEVKAKFDYMYKRITGNKAKKFAKPFYEKATKDLQKI